MNRNVKALLVAGIPFLLGLVFAAGVITTGIKNQKAVQSNEGQKVAVSDTTNSNSGGNDEIKNIVMTTCAGCHGSDLKGQVGPSLYEAAKKYKPEDIEKILKDGKRGEKGQMPAGLVKGKEKEVADFIASLKNQK
jgi:cytochrome c551